MENLRNGEFLRAERSASGKRTSAKLNPVLTTNQYTNIDFPDYEFVEYPKVVVVPMPMDGELPDEEEMPMELRRKVKEFEDTNGQLIQHIEPPKTWMRRCTRLWPLHYPIATNAEEEAKIKVKFGLASKGKTGGASHGA